MAQSGNATPSDAERRLRELERVVSELLRLRREDKATIQKLQQELGLVHQSFGA